VHLLILFASMIWAALSASNPHSRYQAWLAATYPDAYQALLEAEKAFDALASSESGAENPEAGPPGSLGPDFLTANGRTRKPRGLCPVLLGL
jgi:hypothetical protein